MKIRIIENGWHAFTDVFAGVPFVNGVSAREVSQREADLIASIVRAEPVDSTEALGPAARITSMNQATAEGLGVVITRGKPSDDPKFKEAKPSDSVIDEQGGDRPIVISPPDKASLVAPASEQDVLLIDDDMEDLEPAAVPTAEPVVAADAQVSITAKVYTEAELGEIADKAGIDGLREVGGPLGVKARSIKELMAEILQAQAK